MRDIKDVSKYSARRMVKTLKKLGGGRRAAIKVQKERINRGRS